MPVKISTSTTSTTTSTTTSMTPNAKKKKRASYPLLRDDHDAVVCFLLEVFDLSNHSHEVGSLHWYEAEYSKFKSKIRAKWGGEDQTPDESFNVMFRRGSRTPRGAISERGRASSRRRFDSERRRLRRPRDLVSHRRRREGSAKRHVRREGAPLFFHGVVRRATSERRHHTLDGGRVRGPQGVDRFVLGRRRRRPEREVHVHDSTRSRDRREGVPRGVRTSQRTRHDVRTRSVRRFRLEDTWIFSVQVYGRRFLRES